MSVAALGWAVCVAYAVYLATRPNAAAKMPFELLGFALLFGLGTVALVGWRARLAPLPKFRGAAIIVGALTIAWAAVMIRLGLIRHWALTSNLYDLGIFENILYRTSHGDVLGCSVYPSQTHMTEHFDPFLIVLAPIYRIVPAAETLIVVQALWVASATIPLFLLARRLLDERAAGLICGALLLSSFLHANALWDFHSITLAWPLVFWAALAFETRARNRLFMAVAALLLVREDIAFVMIGFSIWVALDRRSRRDGLALLALSVTWVLATAFVLAPEAGVAAHGARFGGGGLLSLITSPATLWARVATHAKLGYLALLVAPSLGLALVRPRHWLLVAPGLCIVALSKSSPVHSPFFHYSTLVVPFWFVASVYGARALSELAERRGIVDRVGAGVALGGGVLASALIASLAFGVLWPDARFRAGFKAVPRSLEPKDEDRLAWIEEAHELVPPDASVCASGAIAAHFAGRRDIHRFPSCEPDDVVILMRTDLPKKLKSEYQRYIRSPDHELTASGFGIRVLTPLGPASQ